MYASELFSRVKQYMQLQPNLLLNLLYDEKLYSDLHLLY